MRRLKGDCSLATPWFVRLLQPGGKIKMGFYDAPGRIATNGV